MYYYQPKRKTAMMKRARITIKNRNVKTASDRLTVVRKSSEKAIEKAKCNLAIALRRYDEAKNAQSKRAAD